MSIEDFDQWIEDRGTLDDLERRADTPRKARGSRD